MAWHEIELVVLRRQRAVRAHARLAGAQLTLCRQPIRVAIADPAAELECDACRVILDDFGWFEELSEPVERRRISA